MKQYLGDSVYVEFDDYVLILTTENGYPDDPRNRIVLGPQVFDELLKFVASERFRDPVNHETSKA